MFRDQAIQGDKKDEGQPIELKDTFQFITERKDEGIKEAALSCDQLATISQSGNDYTLRFIHWRTQTVLKNEVTIEAKFLPRQGKMFGITHLFDSRFLICLDDYPNLPSECRNCVTSSDISLQEAKPTALMPHPFFNPPKVISQNEMMITQARRTHIYSMDNLTVPYTFFCPPPVRGGSGGSTHKLTEAIYAYWYTNGFVTLHSRNDKEFKQVGVPIDLSGDNGGRYQFKGFGPYLVRIDEDQNISDSQSAALFKFDGEKSFVQTCTVPRYEFVAGVWLDFDFARLIVSKLGSIDHKLMMLDPATGAITATLVCGKEVFSMSCAGEYLAVGSRGKGVAIHQMKSGVEAVLKELIHSGLSLFQIPRGVAMICSDYVGKDVQSKSYSKR